MVINKFEIGYAVEYLAFISGKGFGTLGKEPSFFTNEVKIALYIVTIM